MDNLKRIEVGSKAFFSSFDDFKSKDDDVMIIMDNPPRGKTHQLIRMRNTDYFIYKKNVKKRFYSFLYHNEATANESRHVFGP